MSKQVIIASDSTSDLSPELIRQYGIKILPLCVSLGGTQYTDGVDINPDMIYEYYEKNKELPKTSAVNVADFADFFARQTEGGNAVVMFTISSSMSTTYNNARIAAEDFPDVYVVDSKNLSTGGGLLVLSAAEMAAKGMSAAEIAAECEQLSSCVDASFIVDNLEFLHKGGRCSALASLGANLLQLKPQIQVKDGSMGVAKKYRGKFVKVLEEYIQDKLTELDDIEPAHVFITHAGCDAAVYKECLALVKSKKFFQNVHLTRAGCTISSHCGRNTLGILFIRKTPLK